MRKLWEEFKAFALKGDLVTVAVALVLALALVALVGSLVEHIVMPIIGIIFGEPTFDQHLLRINGSEILYGSFITALVTFLMVALALFFFLVKPYQAYQARKARGQVEEAPEPDPEDVVLLREIRDALRASSR